MAAVLDGADVGLAGGARVLLCFSVPEPGTQWGLINTASVEMEKNFPHANLLTGGVLPKWHHFHPISAFEKAEELSF